MTTERPRLLWAISHPTLFRAEVPLLRAAGFDVVPEEPEASVLRTADFGDYPCVDERVGEPGATLHLWARNGCVTEAEARLVNASFDAVMVVTRAEVAVNVRRWFRGEVFFRYFGRLPSLPSANRIGRAEAERARITAVPIFSALLETPLARSFGRAVHLGTTVPRPRTSVRWAGRSGAVGLFLEGVELDGRARALIEGLARSTGGRELQVFGRSPGDWAGIEALASSVRCVGRLDEAAYWSTFAGLAAVVYPHADPGHSHYIPLEAITLGIPCLMSIAGAVAYESRVSVAGAGDGQGLYRGDAELCAGLHGLLLADDRAVEHFIRSQEVLLRPFLPESVLLQAERLRELVPLRRPDGVVGSSGERRCAIPTSRDQRGALTVPPPLPLEVAATALGGSNRLNRGWSAEAVPKADGSLACLALHPGADLLLSLGTFRWGSLHHEIVITMESVGEVGGVVEALEGDKTVGRYRFERSSARGGVALQSARVPARGQPTLRVRVSTALSEPGARLTALRVAAGSNDRGTDERPDPTHSATPLWTLGHTDTLVLGWDRPGWRRHSSPVRTAGAGIPAGGVLAIGAEGRPGASLALVASRRPRWPRIRLEAIVVFGRLVRVVSPSDERRAVVVGTRTGVLALEARTGTSLDVGDGERTAKA